jgi:hypothetical protein
MKIDFSTKKGFLHLEHMFKNRTPSSGISPPSMALLMLIEYTVYWVRFMKAIEL